MKIQSEGEVLSISDIDELGAANSQSFRDKVCSLLPQALKAIEIDLSETTFVDSCGLGALIAVHKTASHRGDPVPVRLLNPRPPVQQLFELTRMHHLFEIVRR